MPRLKVRTRYRYSNRVPSCSIWPKRPASSSRTTSPAGLKCCNGCSGIPYAINRYVNETNRLYGVLNKRLADREFIAGDYSIADMAAYPWIVPWKRQQQNLDDFPHLRRWFDSIRTRPAVIRAYQRAEEINTAPTVSEESRALLFGQTAAVIEKK